MCVLKKYVGVMLLAGEQRLRDAKSDLTRIVRYVKAVHCLYLLLMNEEHFVILIFDAGPRIIVCMFA